MKKVFLLVLGFCTVTLVTGQIELKIDTGVSIIKWSGSNLFKFNKHFGTVHFKNGVVIKEKDLLIGGRFEVAMNSIVNTDGKYNEMLVGHLKNEDFFNVEKYPNAKLEFTDIKYSDSKNIEVKANLTIKNITKPIEFNAFLKDYKDKIEITAKFIIDRTRWKVNYESKSLLNSIKENTISDAIEFEVIVKTKSTL